ncbi:hypothetical protein F4809DRAFT_641681 [Biscogniauxia mediterranea]|nr:hypothetical protein F4809DRAFT_641681 [Biscogniauxia mediterranea]
MSNPYERSEYDRIRQGWLWPDEYFENDSRKFKFEKQLGEGAFGEAWLVKREVEGRVVQRFVAKFALDTEDPAMAETIQTEKEMAQKLYGAMHIAQPIVADGKMLELDSYTPSLLRLILMMEFIPGITIGEFWYRTLDDEARWQPIPNRMLWLIFRCMVRALFALAAPPRKPFGETNEEPTLEPMPEHEPTNDDYQILHNDMNRNNLMFGDLDSGEHSLVPLLKVIDFGVARDSSEWKNQNRTITQQNIRDVGDAMKKLYLDESPNLDEDLKALVDQCRDRQPQNRPTLAALWGRIQNAITVKTGPMHFTGKPRAMYESNDRISQYVQALILDASYQIPPPSAGPSPKGKGVDMQSVSSYSDSDDE